MRKMSVITVLMLAVCIVFGACGSKQETAAPAAETEAETVAADQVKVTVLNTVPDQVSAFTISFRLNGEEIAGTTELADAGAYLECGDMTFTMNESDIPEDGQMKGFSMVFSVAEADGEANAICEMMVPVMFGHEYVYTLKYADGCYSIWSGRSE